MLASESRVGARERIDAYLDVGLGGIRTQPFVTGDAVCATIGLGASTGLLGPARTWFESRATVGRNFPKGNQEAADAGHQSLVTLLGGLEFVNRRSLRGAFLTSGLGIGRSTISDARGPIRPPNFGVVSLHDRTAAAYGLGLGHRFSDSGQLALRTYGLLGAGMRASAYAIVMTAGFTF